MIVKPTILFWKIFWIELFFSVLYHIFATIYNQSFIIETWRNTINLENKNEWAQWFSLLFSIFMLVMFIVGMYYFSKGKLFHVAEEDITNQQVVNTEEYEGSDKFDLIKQLAELKNLGAITEDEFQIEKNKILK